MKRIKYLLTAALLIATAMTAGAKNVKTTVYLFGFSASFQDSTVYFTDIQQVQEAWIDSKTQFLVGRDNYSYQLRNYFDEHQQPNRVCMVMFATTRDKAEKQYLKLRKKYTGEQKKKRKSAAASPAFDIRYLSATDFQFIAVEAE